MFTGIVEELGTIKVIESNLISVTAEKILCDLKISDSISVNGACLTVTNLRKSSFDIQTVPETLRRTNLGLLKTGDQVNLERSLATNSRFGGHIVQGHVDTTGHVTSIKKDGDGLLVTYQIPSTIKRYVVEKGFIAVDGASLTIVNCDNSSFTVTLVPFTRNSTILGTHEVGDQVNLEVDIISKYIESLLNETK